MSIALHPSPLKVLNIIRIIFILTQITYLIALADDMIEAILEMASDEEEDMIIMGDFNICPKKHPAKFQLLSQG